MPLSGALAAQESDHSPDHSPDHYRDWINQFKQASRGPFEALQWLCKDGVVLSPTRYACRDHGGGVQHGIWNAHALRMRENGYLIANLFSLLKPQDYTGDHPRLENWKQILLEQYLIRADDGWVFHRARYYRGAIQAEVEQDSATKIILAMLADNNWSGQQGYLLLRESVGLLPLAVEPLLGVKIRQAASDISEQDKGFHALRVKIHSIPDADDAARVRRYAGQSGASDSQQAYASLAMDLDALYAPHSAIKQLKHLRGESRNTRFKRDMTESIDALRSALDPAQRLAEAASRAQHFRDILVHENTFTVYNRLRFFRASLILEQEAYVQGNRLIETVEPIALKPASASPSINPVSRATRLGWLQQLGQALYATGLLSHRQWQAMRGELERLRQSDVLNVTEYAAALRYLSRITQWCQRSLEFHFSATIKRWQRLTPQAQQYVPDRLRNSPLLPFTRILDTLVMDANQLSGMQHTLFGRNIATGLRALNPGLGRGRLLLPPMQGEALQADGIYIMPSTRHSLTPVAGIITRGEGSSVSHMQLLARNLGIPNLLVDDNLYEQIQTHVGESVVVAISHHGVVNIEADGQQWDAVFGLEKNNASIRIYADLEKLNLRDLKLRPLNRIRARDSGRTVGPKAANLGELKHYYPDHVNPGLVIPFGVFRKHLDQTMLAGGPSVFNWMRAEYGRLAAIEDRVEQGKQRHQFLLRLRQWITNSKPGASFKQQLRRAMRAAFGAEGSYGVFVRSDTNVEDLPGFSGAGLNLTVANVVGLEAMIKAIMRVWASPFTDRAYAWRQAYMMHPEHVYPAVLLLKSFASEQSGVLVISDIDNGDRSILSIATNEGVGGAVEGQFAEEIRVRRGSGAVQLYAQASAPMQAVLNPAGGVDKVMVSGKQYILRQDEIVQLRQLAADVEKRFPLQRDHQQVSAVADIEFGFSQGKLALFQIRPFVESRRALHSQTLMNMDRRLLGNADIQIRMDQPPVVAGL
ncbi:MAG: PEP/pyruvate-binding domain-containing protein [Mariprofundus sp.]|nr:PEP/pyruvate-binding domain-containing protein [Mariprofundus sp.]